MSLSSDFTVTEITNAAVADAVCERGPANWTASYDKGQDFHVEIDIPNAVPGEVYGFSQTLILATRTALYENKDVELIQLWRTPPQQSTSFRFKGTWLDVENPDPAYSNLPYYSSEAMGTTQLRKEKTDGKDSCYVTLRMHKKPQMALPTYIQRKSNKDEKLAIVQFDVQERYLITLFRDKDVKDGNAIPLLQWDWGYKYAWCSKSGQPEFVPHPGLSQKVRQRDHVIDKYDLQGSWPATGPHHDYFRILDKDIQEIVIGEVEEWTTETTEEWEACDM